VAFVFVLSIVVFIHELGHFLTAKRVGVKVHAFSLGFPPNIVAKKWGDTEYRIGAIPLGGYVKMAGENPGEGTGEPDELASKSKWARTAILVMGPAMNIVLSVTLFTVLFMVGIDRPAGLSDPPVVTAVPADSPAARAGILPGDKIVTIDGREVPSWETALETFYLSPAKTLKLGIDRHGQQVTTDLTVEARGKDQSGFTGLFPDVQPAVMGLRPGLPAEKAGLQKSDVIVKVGDEAVFSSEQLIAAITKAATAEVKLTILRQGALQEVMITPIKEGDRFLIGIDLPSPVVRERIGNPVMALSASLRECARYTRLTFMVLGRLLKRELSMRQMMGPIGIAQASGQAARTSARSLFSLMAIISLQLGIFNLLPIPILDGGHIAILFVESLARRNFSVQLKERILQVGFVLLLVLMVTVIYMDLSKIDAIGRYLP